MGTTRPKQFAFVLMPFSDEFVDVYKLGIKPACDEAGGYCERLDDQIFHESMLERIYNQINKADLIIADMTGRNPNVFYEVGYAHALGKKVILLTQRADDIPFDLKHYPHIVYSGSIVQLRDELQRRVQWYMQQDDATQPGANTAKEFEYYIGGKLVTEGATITLPATDIELDESEYEDYDDTVRVRTSLSIHNPTAMEKKMDFGIGLILPEYTELRDTSIRSDTRMPDGRLLTESYMPSSEPVRPQAWTSIAFRADCPGKSILAEESVSVVLRLFTRNGIEDIPFTLAVASWMMERLAELASSERESSETDDSP